jgi:hypothetical protein
VADTVESVVLTVPWGDSALPAMRAVTGWMASRNDLPLDELDDINLGLETLVSGEHPEGPPLSLTVSVVDRSVRVLLMGLQNEALRANLQAVDSFATSTGWPLDVRLFLSALLDEYEVVGCDGGTFGVEMRKRIN